MPRHRPETFQLFDRSANRRVFAAGATGTALAAVLGLPRDAFAQGATPAAATNPLGVDGSQALDILMWKAGWGDEYALYAVEMYKKAFPDAEIKYEAVQRIPEAAQPRFVSGEPPDVIESSGLDLTSLVQNGQLTPVTDLLATESWDTPGMTLGETLQPGSQDNLVYDGVQYGIYFTFGMYGMWYSQPLMEEKGWVYPKTWPELMDLCEEIKGSGIAPFTYPGKYPSYFATPFWNLVWKAGGDDPMAAIDNLQPDAWKAEPVRAAADALYQLRQKGYILEGSEGLSHTESQAEWLQGKAVFIPNGTWLENEMKDLIPEGFDMVVAPTPPLTADGPVGYEGIATYSGQPFTVPAQAKNPTGGLEYIRMLCSKESARNFSNYAHALSNVVGAAEGLDLGTAFTSSSEVTAAAGDQLMPTMRFGGWYKAIDDEFTVQMGSLLTNDITVDEFLDAMQTIADDTANDDSVPKFQR